MRALVELARGLGMDAIAEGVATERQHRWVRELGVPYAQGFLYGQPQPPDAVRELLLALHLESERSIPTNGIVPRTPPLA